MHNLSRGHLLWRGDGGASAEAGRPLLMNALLIASAAVFVVPTVCSPNIWLSLKVCSRLNEEVVLCIPVSTREVATHRCLSFYFPPPQMFSSTTHRRNPASAKDHRDSQQSWVTKPRGTVDVHARDVEHGHVHLDCSGEWWRGLWWLEGRRIERRRMK